MSSKKYSEEEVLEMLSGADEDMGKEASGEDLYEAGYLYGAGLAKGMNDGMEKTASAKEWLASKFPKMTEREYLASGKLTKLKRRLFHTKGSVTPWLSVAKGAPLGGLSKLKAAGVGAGALGVGVGGALGLRALLRRRAAKKGKK